MRKYCGSAAKKYFVLSLICFLFLTIGVILALVDFEQVGLTVLFIGFGGMAGITFWGVAVGEYSVSLRMDDDKIILSRSRRMIGNNGIKKIVLKKVTINFSDIKSVSVRSYKGDGIISKDTKFYIFYLQNGDAYEATFYHYGKKREAEIINRLKEKVDFV